MEANPAACAFYGYTREELIKRKITDINSLPVSEVHAAMGQANGERQNTFRFRHRLATGELRDVEVHSGPIEVDGRRLLYSIIHDVTDSERAQAELQRTVSLLQSTLDSTTDGILAIDRKGRIVSYNQRFARMWRIPPDVLESGDDEKATAFRQLDSARGSIQERRTQDVLHVRNRFRNRRLRKCEAFRRLGHASDLRHRLQRMKILEPQAAPDAIVPFHGLHLWL